MERLLDAADRATRGDRDLRRAFSGPVEDLEEELRGLLLRTAAGVHLYAGHPAERSAKGVASWLTRSADWLRAAGIRSPLLVGAPAHRLTLPERLPDWIDDDTATLVVESVAWTDSAVGLGGLYEQLLELRLRRMVSPAVRLRPNDVWVQAETVLAEAPATRAKWVQRFAGLPKGAVQDLAPRLAAARTEGDVIDAFGKWTSAGSSSKAADVVVLDASSARRRTGSHYTPAGISRAVIERTLAPLVSGRDANRVVDLSVCDPAMGSGAFLCEAASYLAGTTTDLRTVITHCLFGVDQDAVAVDLARFALARLASGTDPTPVDLSLHLRCGDALVEVDLPSARSRTKAFHWQTEFPAVFDRKHGGFDACIGNPPWVAYAGRAAQPLDPVLAEHYARTNPAFAGYRTLHGLFVRRAAELVRSGGRLGLVVPTSVADLSGYAPTRRAHDALCVVDEDLTDFGNGHFEGVFQPCMGLTSTRRDGSISGTSGEPWLLARTDLDEIATRILSRLAKLPHLDASLFGERGFQTTRDDLSHLRIQDGPKTPYVVPIREGTDVAEFSRKPPRTFLDPRSLAGRLRGDAEWRRVRILIRQTARYPIAALADGLPFRNSILAGFENDEWTAESLVAYLNSSGVRFWHFMQHRDARQGMPQLKIGHLRSIPDPRNADARRRLDAVGRSLGFRNGGLSEQERSLLDTLVYDALGLDEAERASVARWAKENPPPKPRRG